MNAPLIWKTHRDGSSFLATAEVHEDYAKWLDTGRCWHGKR